MGLYAYGYRYYDPAIGRFTGVDPIADKFPHVSTYNYAENEPIANIDLHGLQKWRATDGNIISGPYRNSEGAQSATRGSTIPLTSIPHRQGASTSAPPRSISSYDQLNSENASNLSRTSWGETASIYPTANTDNPSARELYNPEKWDAGKLEELQEARSGIEYISTNRNDHTQKDDVDLKDPIEKTVGGFHLKSNLPGVAPEISGDETVRFFLLADSPDAKHGGISSRYYDQTAVKTYGPFYNSGGGDAPEGSIYIIFYSAQKKD